jgi:outer membrane protein assembly factor BamB
VDDHLAEKSAMRVLVQGWARSGCKGLCARAGRSCAPAALLSLMAVGRPAVAQMVVNGPGVVIDETDASEADAQNPAKGFSVKKEDQKVIEQFEDFERYRDKKAWDRAFKALDGVTSTSQANGMAPVKDGFWIPTRQKVLRSLVSLPAEGKEAYRLFNDAKAKQAFDQAMAREAAGEKDTLADLKKAVEQFFVTGVGDKLADHLGDALFEAGDYVGAARAWEQILKFYPETSLSPLRLQVKRAAALARAGRTDQFKQASASIAEKFAGQSVKVAGKDQPVEEYLKSLTKPATQPSTKAVIASESAQPPVTLPTNDHPQWQFVYVYPELKDKMYAGLNQNGWGMQFGHMADAVAAVTTDGKRVFLNWYGIIWALDAETGKLLWWTDHFKKIGEKFNELAQWQVDENRFSLTVANDAQGNETLLAVATNVDKLNNQEPFRLISYDPATGKKKWSSDTGPLNKWAFIGEPLIADAGTLFITAHPKENQEVHLLAVSLEGKLLWETMLGQPVVGNNWRGMPMYPLPMLQYASGTVYVMTGNGAVLAIDAAAHTIEWAFTYERPMGVMEMMQRFGWGGYNMVQPAEPRGASWIADGVLYFKDRGGKMMFALDLGGPSLKWSRAVGADTTVVGQDERNFYLLTAGQDNTWVSTVARDGLKMVKASKLPDAVDGVRPIGSGGSYFVFLSRGIFAVNGTEPDVTKDTRAFRGADRDSLGGALIRVGDKLVSVSNLAVTAYTLPGATTAGR